MDPIHISVSFQRSRAERSQQAGSDNQITRNQLFKLLCPGAHVSVGMGGRFT